MSRSVTSGFAQAFVELLLKPQSTLAPERAIEELQTLETAMREVPELRTVLLSPAVASGRKKAVVKRLASDFGLSPLTERFLDVIIDRRRLALLPGIRQDVSALLDQRLGVARADVVSAQPLSEEQQTRLQTELSRLTGKRVQAEFRIDAAVLGGVTARIGSKIYDGSVRGQLQALRQQLLQ